MSVLGSGTRRGDLVVAVAVYWLLGGDGVVVMVVVLTIFRPKQHVHTTIQAFLCSWAVIVYVI